MRIWVDSAIPDEIEEWNEHPWVSGFTTNPTLVKAAGSTPADLVKLTDKPISIDGPAAVWDLGSNVYRKIVFTDWEQYDRARPPEVKFNITGVVYPWAPEMTIQGHVISVFAGRIMDTGRDPQPTLNKAKRSYGEVLWASVREPYNIVQAEQAGCDIVTVPPAILRKYLDWYGKPLETVAEETISQFRRDAEGLKW